MAIASAQVATSQPKRAYHCLWAVLIARIHKVFALLCPLCGGQMSTIAFIAHSVDRYPSPRGRGSHTCTKD